MPSQSAYLGESIDQLRAANDQLKTRIRELEAELEATQYTAAAIDVLAERKRQVEVEGWTPAHDDEHAKGEMAYAAAAYAVHGGSDDQDRLHSSFWSILWPWQASWWKPTTRRRDLVKAGALILAEIDRLDRAALSADQAGASS
jgi:hypothetical protein